MNLRQFVLELESHERDGINLEMTAHQCGELAELIRGRVGAAFEGIEIAESMREALQKYDDAATCVRLRQSWEGTEV